MPRTAVLRRTIRTRARRWGSTLVCALAWVAAPTGVAWAQSEDQVKAAFLFNFARFVEWPASAFDVADGGVRVCIAGDPAFARIVSKVVSGKKVGDRSVRVEETDGVGEAERCHILYVGDDVAEPAGAIAARVEGRGVFTVGDRPDFARDGGVANFIRTDKKIRFEINAGAAKASGLKISSRLLRLATVVE